MRARSTIASVLVVALALSAGAAAFAYILQRTLISTVQQAATTRATEVAAQVRRTGFTGLQGDLTRTTREGQILQVLDDTGRVVSTSSPRAQQRALTQVRAADGQVVQVRASRVPLLDDDDPYLAVVAGVVHAGARYQVVVSTPIIAQQQSAQTALSVLLLGVPLLVLLVGAATWLLVGRALRPVERIRSRVARFDETRSPGPITVPDTGDEIARLAETMNAMLARLAEAQHTQRRFVADASHELRSPLATLAASVEFAAADPTGRSWPELAPVLSAEVARMGRLVNDLLLLASVDEHALRPVLDDVDLDDLLDDEVRRLRAHPQLVVTATVQAVRVVGDRARLGQALANLADNAARYARSSVLLTLSTAGDGALVVIQDDGPGVAPADRGRVFERFVRLDSSRERSRGGSGLGLPIVLEIVRAHGGTVQLLEADGGGCRVEVRLPAVPWPADAGQPPSAASR